MAPIDSTDVGIVSITILGERNASRYTLFLDALKIDSDETVTATIRTKESTLSGNGSYPNWDVTATVNGSQQFSGQDAITNGEGSLDIELDAGIGDTVSVTVRAEDPSGGEETGTVTGEVVRFRSFDSSLVTLSGCSVNNGGEISVGDTITLATTVVNDNEAEASVTVRWIVRDQNAGEVLKTVNVAGGSQQRVTQDVTIDEGFLDPLDYPDVKEYTWGVGIDTVAASGTDRLSAASYRAASPTGEGYRG